VTADEASATASDNPALTGLKPEALWRHIERRADESDVNAAGTLLYCDAGRLT
jgi:hypothetical protein